MPNHCTNTLNVTGPREQLEAFKAKGTKSEEPDWDLGNRPIGQLGFDYEGPRSNHLINFHAFVPVPEEIQRKGFDKAGYDWQRNNWGTKWPAYDEEFVDNVDSLTYTFTTAWSPPVAFLETVSIQYPDLEFVDEWHEEGGYAGIITAIQGNLSSEEREHPNADQYDDQDNEAELDELVVASTAIAEASE